jgi:hypothetical protein
MEMNGFRDQTSRGEETGPVGEDPRLLGHRQGHDGGVGVRKRDLDGLSAGGDRGVTLQTDSRPRTARDDLNVLHARAGAL